MVQRRPQRHAHRRRPGPFRTSGNKGRPAYEFPIGGDGWVPEGTTKLE
ncbi:hypothetical protein ACFQV4_37585 [Streptomyces thermocarboxydus]